MRQTILALLCAIILPACTHNNGDIGPLFGQWIMTSVTRDGQPIPDLNHDLYNWRFQNDIIMISLADPVAHTSLNYTATWELSGSELKIDFRHTNAQHPDGILVPAEIGFSQRDALYTLRVVTLTSSSMQLTLPSPDGHTYAYTLRKLN